MVGLVTGDRGNHGDRGPTITAHAVVQVHYIDPRRRTIATEAVVYHH